MSWLDRSCSRWCCCMKTWRKVCGREHSTIVVKRLGCLRAAGVGAATMRAIKQGVAGECEEGEKRDAIIRARAAHTAKCRQIASISRRPQSHHCSPLARPDHNAAYVRATDRKCRC